MARKKRKTKRGPAPSFAEVTIGRAGGLSVTVRGAGGAQVGEQALDIYRAAAEIRTAAGRDRVGFAA